MLSLSSSVGTGDGGLAVLRKTPIVGRWTAPDVADKCFVRSGEKGLGWVNNDSGSAFTNHNTHAKKDEGNVVWWDTEHGKQGITPALKQDRVSYFRA